MSVTVAVGASNVNAQGTRVLSLSITDSTTTSPSVQPNPQPNTISNSFAILGSQQVQTVNGTVTVPIPTGAQGIFWQAPSGGTSTLSIKTVSGDTGIPLSKIACGFLYWDTTPPSSGDVFLVSNGVELVQLYWL